MHNEQTASPAAMQLFSSGVALGLCVHSRLTQLHLQHVWQEVLVANVTQHANVQRAHTRECHPSPGPGAAACWHRTRQPGQSLWPSRAPAHPHSAA